MKSFVEKERGCETAFHTHSPFWHLFTPGNLSGIIFSSKEDFKFGMNLMAWCAAKHKDVSILTFALMNNHIHAVCSCREEDLQKFFFTFRKKLLRYLSDRGENLKGFSPNYLPIDNLRSLRNTIVYVNRNGYVVHPDHTPFSFPWSVSGFFFNRLQSGMKIARMTVSEKRDLFKSRETDVPPEYEVLDGYISPFSFCHIDTAESFFRDAHQYMSLLTKNVEALEEMAELMMDKVFLTDEEAFNAVLKMCRDSFNVSGIKGLSGTQKINLANKMHFSLHSSNEQIRRILGMTQFEVDSMFPLSGQQFAPGQNSSIKL